MNGFWLQIKVNQTHWSLRWKTASAPVPGKPNPAASLSSPLYTSEIQTSVIWFLSWCLVTRAFTAIVDLTKFFSGVKELSHFLPRLLAETVSPDFVKTKKAKTIQKVSFTFLIMFYILARNIWIIVRGCSAEGESTFDRQSQTQTAGEKKGSKREQGRARSLALLHARAFSL